MSRAPLLSALGAACCLAACAHGESPPAREPSPVEVAKSEHESMESEVGSAADQASVVADAGAPPSAECRVADVVVRVLVDERGKVVELKVIEDRCGFAPRVVDTIRNHVFEPQIRDGIPVGAWIEHRIHFERHPDRAD